MSIYEQIFYLISITTEMSHHDLTNTKHYCIINNNDLYRNTERETEIERSFISLLSEYLRPDFLFDLDNDRDESS